MPEILMPQPYVSPWMQDEVADVLTLASHPRARGRGIGQALLEGAVYDESGQLLTGSFMDYTMPRADNMPSFDFSTVEIPCRTNAMGVKGCGEAGAIGSPPAVINAITDALGIRDLAMPATPQRVWEAIRNATGDVFGRIYEYFLNKFAMTGAQEGGGRGPDAGAATGRTTRHT